MKKVLIVDDQPQVKELLRVTLEVVNYQILFADGGHEALQLAATEHPDMILLDIMMPDSDIDGLEVCRRLKNNPHTADINVILLSAKGQREDVEAGLAAGADDYITKPFSPVALIQKLEKAMHKSASGHHKSRQLQFAC
jgi:two-component system, OmpR family, phosphate regulon response regulator PhoB